MRILIISASAGHGHVRAAQALEAWAKRLYPAAEVRNVDILDFTAAIYRKVYAASYLRLADSAPELWGYLFNKGDRARAEKRQARIVRAFDRIEFAKFRAMLREFSPDHVFCTHFLPLQILRPYENADWLTFSLNTVITDYCAHGFWAQPNSHRIFVASGEGAEELAIKGIDPSRIVRAGIPIMPEFAEALPRAEARRKLGLDADTPTILAMGGGWGAAGQDELVQSLFEFAPVNVLAVAGRNEKMRAKVAALKPPAGVKVQALGFVNNVHELMAASDLCVTKAGGLTTAECMALGLPMLVPNPIPGQEERNAEYLCEYGACMLARSPGSLRYKLRKFLGDSALRTRMQQAAKQSGKPAAAQAILQTVLGE